ncbi:MAG: DUF2799 domain-containing protein [Pseudomonadota bacterium]
MQPKSLIGCLLAVVLLSGCASMSREECLVSDWHAIGFEDGIRGLTADRIGRYRKDCADHGVSPDLTAYRQGRAEGLEEFCQPQNAFELGANGGQYRGVCPRHLDGEFVDAYRTGRHLYELESSVRSASRQIAYKEKQLDSIKADLAEKTSALIADGTPTEERARLLLETKDLAEEQGRLESEILELTESRGARVEQLEAYRASLDY